MQYIYQTDRSEDALVPSASSPQPRATVAHRLQQPATEPLPMQPPRSPRQRQRQNQPARKQVPYGRPQQLAREGSVISTFKNFVKDTMGWLGSGDSSERHNGQNDVNGKRRHVGDQPPPPGVDDANGDDNHRVKRVRRDSPPPMPQQGYNDPPAKLFRSASSFPFPLHPISDNSKRRTLSPQASLSHDLYSLASPGYHKSRALRGSGRRRGR